MAPSAQAHKRAHSLLLFEKLLNLRDSASPLTLILDTLEQSAQPLIQEFTRRAKAERAKVIFVSFATIKRPAAADIFIKARGKSLKTLATEIASHAAPPRTPNNKDVPAQPQRTLILLDTLNPLSSSHPHLLPAFFSAIITTPSTSLVAAYHLDVPTLPPPPPSETAPSSSYAPSPLALLTHLATAVLRVASLPHAVAARRARERSLPEPEWGLREGREGVLVGLRSGVGLGVAAVGGGGGDEAGRDVRGMREGSGKEGGEGDGLVVEMEMRRRSGRAVAERFVLVPLQLQQQRDGKGGGGEGVERGWRVMVMSDHPAFRKPVGEAADEWQEEMMEATFNLGLTEKQRRDREGVVLPYFDAQVEVGGGEGGRILYDMGREDDFDEEEDEI